METTTDGATSATASGDGAKGETTTSDGGGATGSDGGPESSGGSGSGGAPKNYSRGENQKPVTDAYRQNWNHIFRRGKSRRR